jgi:hypothetical protein
MTGSTTARTLPSAAPSGPTEHDRRADAAGCALTGVAGALVFWLAHTGLSDDGYISLDYAVSLATHGNWGLTPALVSNTATSPLNVLLLAAGMSVSRLLTGAPHPVGALGVVTVGALAATGWWWLRAARALRVNRVGRAIGLGLLIGSPLALSTVGLETTVLVALLIGLLRHVAAPGRRSPAVSFGTLAGLALLTRLDVVVFVAVLALGSAHIRRQWWRAAVPLVALVVPWLLFSWWVLGSAIPTTLAIKQQQDYPQGWTFAGGPLLFLRDSTLPAAVSLLPALLGLGALLGWLALRVTRRVGDRLTPAALFAAAGLGYFLLYCALRVPPYLWYYVPTLAGLDLFLAAAAFGPSRRPGGSASNRPVGVGSAVVVLTALAAASVDLAHGLPWPDPPIFGNYARPGDYARVGAELPRLLNGEAVRSPGELGTLVFYCHCTVVDQFSDPGRALPLIRAQLAAAPPGLRWLLELNYRHLDRGREPVPARFRLAWAPGWVPPARGVWNVASPASGRGHLTLFPD